MVIFLLIHLDLLLTREITLLEALTGFELHVEHLDGRVLKIKSPVNHVTKPNDIQQIDDQGMPIKGRTHSHGKLFVRYEVKFPDAKDLKSSHVRQKLREALPRPEDPPMTAASVEVEHCQARVFTQAESDARKQRRADESDDEEGHAHARSAQCSGTIM